VNVIGTVRGAPPPPPPPPSRYAEELQAPACCAAPVKLRWGMIRLRDLIGTQLRLPPNALGMARYFFFTSSC